MVQHFSRLRDLGVQGTGKLIQRALELKKSPTSPQVLANKTLALIFEKASTRTRFSFEVGINQLGGKTIFSTPGDSQLGRSEPIKDTARVLARYVDGVVLRTSDEKRLEEFSAYSSVPVINALTDASHPCQLLADLLTIYERTPDFSQVRVSWVGDGNNMANSWIEAAMLLPFELFMAVPVGFEPNKDLLGLALQAGAKIFLTHDPKLALENAHYVTTDVWASMGQEQDSTTRANALKGFSITEEAMSLAHPDAKFMHCLPAHRNEEVSEAVLESSASIVWDEAENRLHAQKALLEWIYTKK